MLLFVVVFVALRFVLVAAGVVLLASSASAKTLVSAMNGVDSMACGANTAPCRSIGFAVLNAADGDTILVGPGYYGDVNRDTVEYQRPRSKNRFLEVYEEEGIEQLLFDARIAKKDVIVGYAECAFEVVGSDNWSNARYFTKREMRPLFVEELAVHPEMQGQGIGALILEQLEHLARVRGCTHLVLEVAENNTGALKFYRGRSFYKLDAAIFLAKKVAVEDELLPPRRLKRGRPSKPDGALDGKAGGAVDGPRPAGARRKGSPRGVA